MQRRRRRPDASTEDALKNDVRWVRYEFEGYLNTRRSLTNQASAAQAARIVNTEQILSFLKSPDNRMILERIGGAFSERDGVARLDYTIEGRKFNLQMQPGIDISQEDMPAVVFLLQELGIDFLKFVIVRLDTDELAKFLRTDQKGPDLLAAIKKWKLGEETERLRVVESPERG
ncbi:hypothetical protein M1397_01685 [Candidatus Marsarchaeota archaeon]|nr:hypothetical protein [Candidatus Marsarchaeota archaeon]